MKAISGQPVELGLVRTSGKGERLGFIVLIFSGTFGVWLIGHLPSSVAPKE